MLLPEHVCPLYFLSEAGIQALLHPLTMSDAFNQCRGTTVFYTYRERSSIKSLFAAPKNSDSTHYFQLLPILMDLKV